MGEPADATSAPVEPSLNLLEHLHERWVYVLRELHPTQWQRTFHHPENGLCGSM
jgi:hypothetical protein